MTIEIAFFNIWAILVCIVSNMVIGALWYSPLLFGDRWLALVGKTPEEISKADANKSMSLSIIPAAFSILFLALTLGFVNASTVIDALILGTLVSAGFIGMSAVNLILFENRTVQLTLINVGYPVVALNIAAVILTLWK